MVEDETSGEECWRRVFEEVVGRLEGRGVARPDAEDAAAEALLRSGGAG